MVLTLVCIMFVAALAWLAGVGITRLRTFKGAPLPPSRDADAGVTPPNPPSRASPHSDIRKDINPAGLNQGVATTLTINLEDVIAGAKEFQRQRSIWSDIDTGPISVKHLTKTQAACLKGAINGKRIMLRDVRHPIGDAPSDIEFYGRNTISSLLRNGFIQSDGRGVYVCTDHGRKAFYVVPRR